ncbi:MAG TPA: DUF4157 domain-containing protein, partial [Chitinophaga sp.]|uniref:eCIS core domain-containing protein n=1 Tax=Chitinophaga sp. TaxID=1869181 RepID=UPI002D1C081E
VVQRMSETPAVQAKAAMSATPATPAAAPASITAVPSSHTPAAAVQPPALQMKEQETKEEENSGEEKKIQRKPIFDSMADPPEDRLQRKATGDAQTGHSENTASPSVEQRLQHTKGAGTPLPSDTRSAMESSMGADFSNVRVHTGSEAASLSNDLQAQAFTHGSDIYFNEGKFDAASSTGRHLLAHELTHTVQQGASIQKKPMLSPAPDSVQRAQSKEPAGAAAAHDTPSAEVVNISSGTFNPSAKLHEEIKAAGEEGMLVRISGGKIAGAGIIRVREKEGILESVKKKAFLPLNVPLLAAMNPTLAVSIESGEVKGFATVGEHEGTRAVLQWIESHEGALSWLTGIDVGKVPAAVTNTFESGHFTFTANGINVKVGGFADATMDLGFTDMEPAAHVITDIDIKGVATGHLDITLKESKFSGEGNFAVNYHSFSGNIDAKFAEGVLDVKGTVAYANDKLGGSITLLMTDEETANKFAVNQVKGGKAEEAELPAEVPAAKGKGKRALAGMGTLTFKLTDWFAGTVNVIVDGKGYVTVIGKIAPPKEIILFEQQDHSKELFKFEARASYGIPVIGNVFVFANIGLTALAKIGPAKIYNIEVNGTYSNNPEIAKEISLSGSLNISAFAGLRLRAEGGAGLELLGHDLKVGVGVNADAGVKGYIDARPTIGYRDPGEFFFKGHMEIAAQPFLGLSGDLFVEVDSPWWSPLPDKKWTWPIGALEYPLPGEFGIGADVEYVLGSGKVPEITFGKADFDGQKFMTDLVDDHVPQKTGKDKGEKQGKFVDGGAAAPPAAGGAPSGKAGGGKTDKGGKPAPAGKPAPGAKQAPAPAKGGKGKEKDKDKADPQEVKNFADAMKKVKALEGHKPMTHEEIVAAVEAIKKQHNVANITIAAKGNDKWRVTGSLKGKGNKQSALVPAVMKPGDDKKKTKKDVDKDKKLAAGVQALKDKDRTVAGDGVLTRGEAEKVAKDVRNEHKNVFKSITVLDDKTNWKYHYIQKADKPDIEGSKKADEKTTLKEGGYLKSPHGILKITKVDIKGDKVYTIKLTEPKKEGPRFVISSALQKGTIKVYDDKILPVRQLPAEWDGDKIRSRLYDSPFNWQGKQAKVMADPSKGEAWVKNRVKKVKASGDENAWKRLAMDEFIVDLTPDNQIPKMEDYDPDKVKYSVDHKDSISKHWNKSGNNAGDDERKYQVVGNDSILRVITARWNSKLVPITAEKYHLFVRPGFNSKLKQYTTTDFTIGTESFRDETGKPIA